MIGYATVLSILSRWLKQTILASKKILQSYLCQGLMYSLIKMDVKQFLINVQDIYQLIKKPKSLVIIGFLIISLISNPLYTTQKNNQKWKKDDKKC